MTDINDVLDFISTEASDRDIERVWDATKIRSRHLRDIRASRVDIGTTVVIKDIRPAAYKGLSGVVTKIDGKYAEITLDAASTRTLARSRVKAAARIPHDATEHTVRGIPL